MEWSVRHSSNWAPYVIVKRLTYGKTRQDLMLYRPSGLSRVTGTGGLMGKMKRG